MERYEYLGSSDARLDENSIEKMVGHQYDRQITSEEFKQFLETHQWWWLQAYLGYGQLIEDFDYPTSTFVPSHPTLRLDKDYAVRFHRSYYEGVPCIYVVKEGVEHVFIQKDSTPPSYPGSIIFVIYECDQWQSYSSYCLKIMDTNFERIYGVYNHLCERFKTDEFRDTEGWKLVLASYDSSSWDPSLDEENNVLRQLSVVKQYP
jgi:hypothetical protein